MSVQWPHQQLHDAASASQEAQQQSWNLNHHQQQQQQQGAAAQHHLNASIPRPLPQLPPLTLHPRHTLDPSASPRTATPRQQQRQLQQQIIFAAQQLASSAPYPQYPPTTPTHDHQQAQQHLQLLHQQYQQQEQEVAHAGRTTARKRRYHEANALADSMGALAGSSAARNFLQQLSTRQEEHLQQQAYEAQGLTGHMPAGMQQMLQPSTPRSAALLQQGLAGGGSAWGLGTWEDPGVGGYQVAAAAAGGGGGGGSLTGLPAWQASPAAPAATTATAGTFNSPAAFPPNSNHAGAAAAAAPAAAAGIPPGESPTAAAASALASADLHLQARVEFVGEHLKRIAHGLRCTQAAIDDVSA